MRTLSFLTLATYLLIGFGFGFGINMQKPDTAYTHLIVVGAAWPAVLGAKLADQINPTEPVPAWTNCETNA